MTRRNFLARGVVLAAILSPLIAGCGAAAAPTTAPTAPPAPTLVPSAVPTVAPTTAPPTVAPPPPTATTVPPPTAIPPTATPAASPTPSLVKSTVRAVAYGTDERGQPRGSIHPFTLSVQPGPREQEFRLGFFETDVGQFGPIWRAAGWMATSVGALETGRDINSLKVSWETNGRIDGPSAGALMTSAFIASVLGHKMREDVILSGSINPDGSIGPVGGLAYKLDAIVKDGKIKTFLIPVGQRYDSDSKPGQTIDLVSIGQLGGVKVQEVADLAESYEVLTGSTLPRAPATSRAPDLSPATYDKMRPKVMDWLAEYADAAGRFRGALPAAQEPLKVGIKSADAKIARAQKALGEGSVALAYRLAQEATIEANFQAMGARVIETAIQTKNLNAATDAVIQTAGVSRVAALFERLKSFQANTPDDAILAISAWSNVLTAAALQQAAEREAAAAQTTKDNDERLKHLLVAVLLQSTEKYVAKSTEDLLGLGLTRSGTGQVTKVDQKTLESWAGVFKRAAEANLTYFDALVLDQYAQALGVRTDVIKAAFAEKSFDYQTATLGAAPETMDMLEKGLGKTQNLTYAQLGFAMASYLATSDLIAQHYSLDAKLDRQGDVVGFGRERALTAMLDSAADRAKERIAAAEKLGLEPSLAILAFQNARAAREGSVKEKVSALREYWTAAMYARLLTLMVQGTA